MDKHMIANDLLPVYQSAGDTLIDGRELHSFMRIGRDFTSWIKDRIEKYGFVDGEDFTVTLTKTGERQNVIRHDYILKIDMAKELCMVENNEHGRSARKYFISIEKQFRFRIPIASVTPTPLTDFQRIDELLRILKAAQRDDLLNAASNRAIRTQVAEIVLGHPIPTEISQSEHPLIAAAPVWVPREGFSAKSIGQLVNCVASKVGTTAKKHGLQTDEYGAWYDYTSKGAVRQIFLYNEQGKEELLKLLKDSKSTCSVQ